MRGAGSDMGSDAGSGSVHYTLSIRLHALSELQPFNEIATAVYDEYSLLGLTYTCTQTTKYTEIRAADHITLQFPALTQAITSSPDGGAHFDPILGQRRPARPAVS